MAQIRNIKLMLMGILLLLISCQSISFHNSQYISTSINPTSNIKENTLSTVYRTATNTFTHMPTLSPVINHLTISVPSIIVGKWNLFTWVNNSNTYINNWIEFYGNGSLITELSYSGEWHIDETAIVPINFIIKDPAGDINYLGNYKNYNRMEGMMISPHKINVGWYAERIK
jgi:hypothetical protein